MKTYGYFIALLTLPARLAAQTPPVAEDITVVATRTPVPMNQIGQSVTVLDQATIEASQAIEVADLLAQTPGIEVARDGGEGQPTSVFIRGAESDQTLVLVDGVQLNDPSSTGGGFDFGNLLMGDITRIEILRGAQSTLWGSQAIGGVVNIITAQPSKTLEGDAVMETGSHGTFDYRLGAGGTFGNLTYRLAGSYYDTAGIPAFDSAYGGDHNDGFHNTSLSGRLGYAFTPDISLDLRGYTTRAYAAFDGYDTPTGQFGNDREFGRILQYLFYGGLNFSLFDGGLRNRLAVDETDTSRQDYDPGLQGLAPSTETFTGNGRNTRVEYQGNADPFAGLHLVFGAQHELSTIASDTPAYDTVPSPVHAQADLDSVYGQAQRAMLPGLTLTGGVRYDHHSEFGGHVTGQAAIAYSPDSGKTILRASFAQGFKAPSLYQLYGPYGTETLHLPPLRPETANAWDAGIERHFLRDRAVVSATYFGRDTRNLIDFLGSVPGAPLGAYVNVGHATAEGLELQVQVSPVPSLTVAANYTLTDAEDVTDHSPLLERPKNAFNGSVTYVAPFRLTTTASVRTAGISHDEGFTANFMTVPVTLKSYTLVDLRLSYPINRSLEAFGRVEDVFNEHYETAYLYGTPGRGAYIGIRARL